MNTLSLNHVLPLVAIAVIITLMAASALLARRRAGARAPSTQEASTQEASTEDAPEKARNLCQSCGGDEALFQQPTIIEVRSALFDASFLDDLFLRLGLRREVRHATRVHHGIEVSFRLCDHCYRMARAACDKVVADVAADRARAAVEEARKVADFVSWGLAAHLQEQTKDQRAKRRRDNTQGTVAAGRVSAGPVRNESAS